MIEISTRGLEDLTKSLAAANYRLTPAAMLRIGERQRARILARVAKGRDVNDRPFHPYSTHGPVYINPGGESGSKKRIGAAKRQAKLGGTVTAGGSVKYESYAAYKRSLGRAGVDLAGRRRRMLAQVVTAKASDDAVAIGVYTEAAGRAEGHQKGTKRLPQREWLGATPSEQEAIRSDIEKEQNRVLAQQP